jgi:NADH-quinone oxidoreductase subunit N
MGLPIAQLTVAARPSGVVFWPLAPELALAGTAIVLLLVDALIPRRDHRFLALLSLAGVAGAAALSLYLWVWVGQPGHAGAVLGHMVAADRFAVVLRLVILGVAAIGVVLSYYYLDRANEARGEYYPLLLIATSGMTLIVSSADLIMVFLALEILSLSLYLLTGFSFRRLASSEASMKYFLLGAFSSAFFLYGVALAYGATGTTNIAAMGAKLGAQSQPALAIAAAGLLGAGFAFKVAAVPFHMWTPDAYQGAPTSVTACMSAGTKVAAFGAFLRVFDVAFASLVKDWQPFVWALAAATMVVGSTLAIAQSDVKRMLAYSSIAHAGFVLVGVTAAGAEGVQAVLFYLAAYATMIVGAFGVVTLVSVRGEANLSLSSYAGLAGRSPWLAATLALFLLSLAGIPPTAGFIAKVAVFSAAVQAGFWPLVLIAVIASVIAAFFYIRVVVLMYMQEPAYALPVEPAPVAAVAVLVPAALTLLFGVFPGLLFTLFRQASTLAF